MFGDKNTLHIYFLYIKYLLYISSTLKILYTSGNSNTSKSDGDFIQPYDFDVFWSEYKNKLGLFLAN